MSIDFDALASRLLQQARSLLAEWFPEGRLHGHEFKIGDIYGSRGESLSININSGQWKDFANPDLKGGDLISLYAAMQGINNAEAARKLEGDNTIASRVTHAPPIKDEKRETWTAILPVPAEAPVPTNDYYRRGPNKDWLKLRYVTRWAYTSPTGDLLGYAVRFEWYESEGENTVLKKDIVPQVYAVNGEGKKQWRWRSFPDPRPLYNLAELRSRPDAPVIIVEGEKKVDALRKLAPQYVGIAWPGGASSWKKADWSPIFGRTVLCWPDADRQIIRSERQAEEFKLNIGDLIPRDHQPGMRAMWEIGHFILSKCPVVKVIIPDDDTLPDGWDCADAVADGWDWQRFKDWALPRVYNLSEGGNGQGSNDVGTSNDRSGNVSERDTGGRGVHGQHETDIDAANSRLAAAEATEEAAASRSTPRPAQSGRDTERAERADQGTAAGLRASADGAATERGDRGETRPRTADIGGMHGVSARVSQSGDVRPAADGEKSPARGSEAQTPVSQIGRWIKWGIERNGNGIPVVNLNNAVRVLEADPMMRGIVWFDEFLQRVMTGDPAREWGDSDDFNLQLYMQREVGISKMGVESIRAAVVSMAMRDRRNCVRDWLSPLNWDGESRIESFMINVFGAIDTPFVRAVSRNFFIGLVARVFEPGCKQDNIVVLEGSQGLSKSSALMALVGPRFYSEQHESATNVKAFAEILQGKWLIEVSEMDAFARSEVTRVKQVASCQSDRYRDSYARYASDHPRQCSMAATANKDDWNHDETGARRFWPIACKGAADINYVKRWREQLFAEAVSVYLKPGIACEPEARIAAEGAWWMVPDAEARNEQRKRYDGDPWLAAISGWLLGKRDVTVNEIAASCLKIELKDLDKSREMRIARCLRVMGWVNGGNKRRAGSVVKVWEPGSDQYGEPKQESEVATVEVATENELPFQ